MSSGRRMAVPDAHLLWLSAKVPNDQFLLFVFDGTPSLSAVEDMYRRAEATDELRLRVRDDGPWRYPRWVRGVVSHEQFVVHKAGAGEWQDCLGAVALMADRQLDVTDMAWRVHVLPLAKQCVVVVQIAHALADGTRSAALAAALLGRPVPIPDVSAPRRGSLLWRSVVAARAHRRLVADTNAGLLPPPGRTRAPLSVNARAGRSSAVRVIAVARERLVGPTVTVGALIAISEALGGYLADRGEDVGDLGAEIPMAFEFGQGNAPLLRANNNFRNVGVSLHPQVSPPERGNRIAAELDGHRRRTRHAATRSSAAAFDAVPAALLRWGVRQFDPSARPAAVSGHTVVSSVNRGPADLSFGGRPVLLTAGFPALSPNMGLTHGVHGIGDTVAIGVHADPDVVDVDAYVGRLECALRHSH